MVKVPIGKKVTVNLWDSKKQRGIVKYFTDTMDLVRAESEFSSLQKGDTALVVESHDSFVVIVPEDEYTQLLDGTRLDHINLKGVTRMIWKLLQERKEETGGILSFEEVWSIFRRSSIQNLITRKHLKRALKLRELPFDHLKFHGMAIKSNILLKLGKTEEITELFIEGQGLISKFDTILIEKTKWAQSYFHNYLGVFNMLNGDMDPSLISFKKSCAK